MLAIKEIGFIGKLSTIDTSDEKLWKTVDDLKVFSGDFYEWYMSIRGIEAHSLDLLFKIDPNLIRNNVKLTIKIAQNLFKDKGIIVVTENKFHFIKTESIGVFDRLDWECRGAPHYVDDQNSRIIILYKGQLHYHIDFAIKYCKISIRDVPSSFWDIYLKISGQTREEFIKSLECGDMLQIETDGTIGFRNNGTKTETYLIESDLDINVDRFSKSNFIGSIAEKKSLICMKNVDCLDCIFSNAEIQTIKNDGSERIIHESQVKYGGSVYFSQCVFNSCAINVRHKCQFDNCTFINCKIDRADETELYEPVFFGKTLAEKAWKHVPNTYTVNGVKIRNDTEGDNDIFVIIYDKNMKEYLNPGNMISEDSILYFENPDLPDMHIRDTSKNFDSAMKRAIRLFRN